MAASLKFGSLSRHDDMSLVKLVAANQAHLIEKEWSSVLEPNAVANGGLFKNDGVSIEMSEFQPRLYLVSKVGNENYFKGFLKEMPLICQSLNQQDVFVLDAGCKIYVWSGEDCDHCAKQNATLYANSEASKRSHRCKAAAEIDDAFWDLLGGYKPIQGKGVGWWLVASKAEMRVACGRNSKK